MIVTRIWGGLGNQMFQFIIAYAISKETNQNLVLDTSFFSRNLKGTRITPRELKLFKLPIGNFECIENTRDLQLLIRFCQIPIINYAIRKVNKDYVRIGNYYLETQYIFHKEIVREIVNSKNSVYLDGYWHCEKYFSLFREEVLKMFTFTNEKIRACYNGLSLSGFDTVAVHIRRGDYITQNNPNVQDEEYYRRGINLLMNKVKNPRFCFFSDDPQWVLEKFSDLSNMTVVNQDRQLSDVEELQVMRKCNHAIISNSSFSWWGAWLNENSNRLIVAPKEWKNKKDMMPTDWIRL